jgi:hypothetical protein
LSATRLLLPFTEQLDARSIDYAIRLAQSEGAVLILLSLLVVRPEYKSGKIRLEQIQQSKDFLVFTTNKAHRVGVPVETHEIYTHDAVQSLTLQAQEQMCDAILLFVRNKQGVLLQSDEIKRTLEWQGMARYVLDIPMPISRPLHTAFWTGLARWWKTPFAERVAAHLYACHADKNTHPSILDHLSK